MIFRYLVGVLVGAMVALSSLWLMQYLIKIGNEARTENPERYFMDFVRVERSEDVQRKDRKPKKPPPPEAAPPPPQPQQQDKLNPDLDALTIPKVSISDGSVDISRGGRLTASDGEYLPFVKVAPVYPRRAQERGIEGYCTVEYTVTTSGSVENPQVVDCSSSVFHRASINAALKFKYKPRVVDGEAMSVPGVRNRFTYVLEQ